MSRFDSIMADMARPTMQEHLGRTSCVYIAPDGAETPVTAILTPETVTDQPDDRGRVGLRQREAVIGTDPAATGGGVADPGPRGKFRIDGETWAIDRIDSKSGSHVRLCLEINERNERTRPDYRRPGR